MIIKVEMFRLQKVSLTCLVDVHDAHVSKDEQVSVKLNLGSVCFFDKHVSIPDFARFGG